MEQTQGRVGEGVAAEAAPPRAVLVGLERAGAGGLWSPEASLAELAALARTAGLKVVGTLRQSVREVHPAYYLGRGKVAELNLLAAEVGAEVVVADDELTPSQQRNLERALGQQVMDRTALILDIFAQHARTREGHLQVELARQQYLLPRLSRRWPHLSRQVGIAGARGGPGETQLEVDRRQVRQRIGRLKEALDRVRQQRSLYRRQRRQEGPPIVGLVGYTNAGKSTLFNALTAASVPVEDKLFATLDPATRRLVLPSGQQMLISDTVGFIQKLPPTVISAFRATLEELHEASLLVHVLDITHAQSRQQGETVMGLLAQLGLGKKPLITALNKVDLLLAPPGGLRGTDSQQRSGGEEAGLAKGRLRVLCRLYPEGVPVAAARGWGLRPLLHKMEKLLAAEWTEIKVEIPYAAGSLLALFRERGWVLAETYSPNGTVVRGKVPGHLAPAFRPYRIA